MQKVIDGLKENKGVDKLYIFQDGLKCEEHRSEWEKTQMVIKGTEWCEIVYYQASYNKGLAKSIVDGVNIVFEENDAVVVLEDDCVPHPMFMDYMTECLERYQNNEKVFSINGSSWNVCFRGNREDVYFIGRINSCGWATWKDRWEFYEQDYKMLARIRRDPEKRQQLDIWGQDLESHLLGNIYGLCDSWAVFWALKCIEKGGLCPTPYYSLIDNIGFDGTGVHSGNTAIDILKRERTDMKALTFPDVVEFPVDYASVYTDWFKWTSLEVKLNCYNKMLIQWNTLLQNGIGIVDYFKQHDMKSLAIWGRGNLCKALIKEIGNIIEVKHIIESKPINKQFENISVISPDEVTCEVDVIVVIPVYDMARIRQKVVKEITLIGLDELLENVSEKWGISI